MTKPFRFNILKLITKIPDDSLISFFESSQIIKQKFPEVKTKLTLDFLINADENTKMFVIKVIKKHNGYYLIMDATKICFMSCEFKLNFAEKYVIYGILHNETIICQAFKKANFYELCNGLFD